jgi:hypothetical protein
MMSYEKAVRELPFLGFMFELLIVVAGGGVVGEFTVSEIPVSGIPFE